MINTSAFYTKLITRIFLTSRTSYHEVSEMVSLKTDLVSNCCYLVPSQNYSVTQTLAKTVFFHLQL